jgi:hypothetical protein
MEKHEILKDVNPYQNMFNMLDSEVKEIIELAEDIELEYTLMQKRMKRVYKALLIIKHSILICLHNELITQYQYDTFDITINNAINKVKPLIGE